MGDILAEMFAFNLDLLFLKVIKLRITISSIADLKKFQVFKMIGRALDSAVLFQYSLEFCCILNTFR